MTLIMTKRKAARRAAAKPAITRAVLGTERTKPAGPPVPRRWAWHYRVLLSLRDRLLRQRGGSRGAVAQPIETHSMSEADSASDEFDHDLGLSELSAGQDALYEVDQALRRILDGTYGQCEETGKPIDAARLRAIPWARRTREAEERLEKQGLARRPHLAEVQSVRASSPDTMEAVEERDSPGGEAPAKDETLREVDSPPVPHLPAPAAARKSTRRVR